MRDPLLDEIADLFSADVPPPALTPRPTGLAPMKAVDEPVRGPSRQLVFHVGAGRMYLQLDAAQAGLRLTGVLDDKGVSVEVRSPDSAQALRPDAEGWFRADVAPGPLCVTVPELGLTTGWFVA
ncbi:hypothetical protein C8D88_101282 [Lentzea atacamensis]|uniref:Uncharacterized protein n=2 Tax=Lentzea TaxID=165301 RepID=A0A316IBR4_9PSEU|nr:hypothetical protein [Lentzea atacamensis]PWK90270.1 hypothetical protein C8D88_101282 [Lentzea atacamensis]RAS68505.1 hypothetical protein C8D87_102574 [Lentzea atacamensis]